MAKTSESSAGDAVTRSEEELQVRTTQRESARVRLQKYIVTEMVTMTVPVRREEFRLEREPITEANRGPATPGAEVSDEEYETILHEEEVVIEKRVVPKERVRVVRETVTDEREITEEVRKEQIDVDAGRQASATHGQKPSRR